MQYGLIGKKLEHSYSKIIHEMLRDAPYELVELTEEEVDSFLKAKEFLGMNVTIPYKQTVIPYMDELDSSAEKIGAVNTIVHRDGRLIGYNTDYYGFVETLKAGRIDITDRKVLVLGNGGASKAILAALRDFSPSEIITVKYKEEPGVCTYETAARLHTDAALVVNTSPVGMYPNVDASPLDLTPYKHLRAVIDIIYNPKKTKLLLQAESLGIPAYNGLLMLVQQARRASELFFEDTLSDTHVNDIYQRLYD